MAFSVIMPCSIKGNERQDFTHTLDVISSGIHRLHLCYFCSNNHSIFFFLIAMDLIVYLDGCFFEQSRAKVSAGPVLRFYEKSLGARRVNANSTQLLIY